MREQSRMLSSSGNQGDEAAGRIAMQLHDLVCQASSLAIRQVNDNKVHGIIVAMHAGVAAVHMLAKMAAGYSHKDDALTSTQVLFAALLAYHSAPYEIEVGKSCSEYSPLIIAEALKDFEKLTGCQPDDELDEQMCRVCRKFAADPAGVAEINSQRAQTLATIGHTIN